jgi:hypothetical protein
MSRKSAVSKEYRIDETKNRIPGNQDPERHIQYIFETVIRSLVNEDAGLDVLATAGGMEVLRYLEDNCKSRDQSIYFGMADSNAAS